MKNKFLCLIFFLICSLCFCQQEVTWRDLSKVKYSKKYFPEEDDYFMYPKFLAPVRALNGKRITVRGFFLNLEDRLYILSKGPMSSCYFCGQGGPETAIELQFDNKQNFKTDTIIAITGVLKINEDDVDHFNYILTECVGEPTK